MNARFCSMDTTPEFVFILTWFFLFNLLSSSSLVCRFCLSFLVPRQTWGTEINEKPFFIINILAKIRKRNRVSFRSDEFFYSFYQSMYYSNFIIWLKWLFYVLCPVGTCAITALYNSQSFVPLSNVFFLSLLIPAL